MRKADDAATAGDFLKAEELYGLLWQVFPKDIDIQLKYADAILKVDNSPNRQRTCAWIVSGYRESNAATETRVAD